MGLKVVIAKSFARIHWQNLINFGMLPLTFVNPDDYDGIDQQDILEIADAGRTLRTSRRVRVHNRIKATTFETEHAMSPRQIDMVLEGSLINLVRKRQQSI